HGVRGGPNVSLGHARAVPTHEKKLGSELGHGGTRARRECSGAGAERPGHAVSRRPNIVAVADGVRAAYQPEAVLEGDEGGRFARREARGEWLLRPGNAI